VECVWQDPTGNQDWQLLLQKVCKVDPTIFHDLIARVIGTLTQEVNLFLQASVSQNDKVLPLFAANNQETLLKSLRLLDNILLVFCENEAQEWRTEKELMLFGAGVGGGPSLCAAMVQVYLNVAVNVFEFSVNNPER